MMINIVKEETMIVPAMFQKKARLNSIPHHSEQIRIV